MFVEYLSAIYVYSQAGTSGYDRRLGGSNDIFVDNDLLCLMIRHRRSEWK